MDIIEIYRIFYSKRDSVFQSLVHLTKRAYGLWTIGFILSLLGTISVRAQELPSHRKSIRESPELKLAAIYMRKSSIFMENAKYDSSSTNLYKALNIYRRLNDTDNIILCYAHLAYLYSSEGNLHLVNRYLKMTQSMIGQHDHLDPSTRLIVYDDIGGAYRYESKYDTAQQYFNKACLIYKKNNLQPGKEIVKLYNDLGALYLFKDQNKLAIKYLKKALSLGLSTLGSSNLLISKIYNNIGLSAYNSGNLSEALKYYHKDLTISKKLLGRNNPGIGKTYNNIGGIYFAIGDYGNAAEYYKEALRIFILNYGQNQKQVARVYNNIGAVYYYEKNYQKAIDYFKKSLIIKKQIFGDASDDVAIAYLNIGDTYYKIKKQNQAIYYFKKSLAINLKLFNRDNPNIAPVYESLSECYSVQKKYEIAIAYLNKELNIYIHSYGFNHPLTANTLISIGKVYRDDKNYKQALHYFQQALISLCPEFDNKAFYTNPRLTKIRSQKYLLTTLKYKAETLYNSPGSLQEKTVYLIAALQTYNLATKLIGKIRKGYKAEESKLFLGEETHTIYEGGIKTCLKLYQITHQLYYKKEAFEFLEKSKSNVLLEAILDSKAKEFSGIPDSLLNHEQQLKKDLAYYNTELHNELSKGPKADSLKVIYWQNKIFSGNRLYNTFIERLENRYPKYYRLKYRTPNISISEIRNSLLDEHSALLSYFKGEKTLYIFTVTKNSYQIKTEKIGSTFISDLKEFRKGITDNNFSEYTQKAYELYHLLLAPARDAIRYKNLMIIPDGVLGYIPFGALLTKPVQTGSDVSYTTYKNLPYVILHHNITYSYSTTLLLELSRRPKYDDPKEFLGIAPVFESSNLISKKTEHFRSDNPITPLPASETEVKDIYNLFENNRGFWSWLPFNESEVLLRKQATESFVKSSAISQFRYIHFATHAFINEQNPNLSGVILAHKPGSGQDGILYAGEIYNLKLHADLVVLSACETAMGKLVKGEGIMSLTRSFLYAGASNVIVSLWKVADRSTAKFMIDFYKNLLDKRSISSSLGKAKRHLIRDTQYSSPIYWSPFILIGSK